VKVPETLLVVAFLVGVGVAEADAVACGDSVSVVAAALFVAAAALFVAAAVLVGVALLVAEALGDGLLLEVAAGAAVVVFAAGIAAVPPIETPDSDEVICGGVMARTAPSPPTVPPAINSARFMPLLSLSYL
jgi:hypothetical protein